MNILIKNESVEYGTQTFFNYNDITTSKHLEVNDLFSPIELTHEDNRYFSKCFEVVISL